MEIVIAILVGAILVFLGVMLHSLSMVEGYLSEISETLKKLRSDGG
jgi:hypothetical protein